VSLTPLACSNCGAPLTAEPVGNVIRCPYCQAEHAFVVEAPPRVDRSHAAGEAVLVMWGERWWAGHVLEPAGEVDGEAQWKVHYDGWSDRWDEVVSAHRIRPRAAAAAAAPRRAGVWVGAIVGVLALVIVGAVVSRGGSSAAEQRPARRGDAVTAAAKPTGSAPGTPLEPNATLREGDPVWGYSLGKWWKAEVVRRTASGRWVVRYVGYDDKWNESLGPSELRRR
jgi:hypothetical protein